MTRLHFRKAQEATNPNGHNPLLPSKWQPQTNPGAKATGNPSIKQQQQQQQQQVRNMTLGGGREGLPAAFQVGPGRRPQGQPGLANAAGRMGENPYPWGRQTNVRAAPGRDRPLGPPPILRWVERSARLEMMRSQLTRINTDIPAVLPSDKPSQGTPTRRVKSAPLPTRKRTPFREPRSAPLVPGRNKKTEPPSQPPPELPPFKGNNQNKKLNQKLNQQLNPKDNPKDNPSGPATTGNGRSKVMPVPTTANNPTQPGGQTSTTSERRPPPPPIKGATPPVAKGARPPPASLVPGARPAAAAATTTAQPATAAASTKKQAAAEPAKGVAGALLSRLGKKE